MNAAQGDDDDRATAWLPNELWMAIMRAVPVTGDIEGMRALWALRGVSRKWRALVDATLVVFFQDFELNITVDMKSLEYKTVYNSDGNGNNNARDDAVDQLADVPQHLARGRTPPGHTNNTAMFVPLAASHPAAVAASTSATTAPASAANSDPMQEGAPRTGIMVGFNTVELECRGYDCHHGVYEFVPKALPSPRSRSTSSYAAERRSRETSADSMARMSLSASSSASPSSSMPPSSAPASAPMAISPASSSAHSSPVSSPASSTSSNSAFSSMGRRQHSNSGLMSYTRLGAADSIRDMRISFDGWRNTYERFYKVHSPILSPSSSRSNINAGTAPASTSLRAENTTRNPYHNRVYRLELNDLPGVHYIGERDMIMQYTLRRFENELVRYVPRPGGAPGEKMAIRAHDVRYQFRLERILVHPTWIINGMLPLGATNCEQIFTRAFDAIVAKTREFAGRDADRVNHDTINVRSEFVLHYLQKHYNLIQAISDVSSSRHSFASGDEHLLLNDPTLLAQLCQHLLANNALADRRFLITQRIRANADFLPLINWIRLPPDESWWPCDAIVRFIMGRSQSQPPYSATVVMRGTMPALEFDGVVVRNTGEFQSDERVMVEIDRLTRRWYEVLLGELKMQR